MKERRYLSVGCMQILFVCFAFAAMVLTSYFCISRIMQSQLRASAQKDLDTADSAIQLQLLESEHALVSSGVILESLFRQDCNYEGMSEYLVEMSDWMVGHTETGIGFYGIYADVDGTFMHGMNWSAYDGFLPAQRPWYTAAIKAQGEIAFTEPYLDARTQEPVISASKELYDSEQKSIGVVAVDMSISHITDYVVDLHLVEGGYGILMDSEFNILAHHNAGLIGMEAREAASGYEEIQTLLAEGKPVTEYEIIDTDGTKEIVFCRPLSNGWYLGLVTPMRQYYQDLYIAFALLLALGLVLMLILSVILHRLNRECLILEDENRSKTSFLANMSHEIRTPMNAVIGMSELALRDATISASVKEQVAAIHQSGLSLLSIINSILDISKIESGKLEITECSYLFASMLNDVMNVIRVRLLKKSLSFVVYVDSSIPAHLIGDELRVRQILLNLLNNAVKYTDEGTVSLHITGEPEASGRYCLRMVVSDTGIGIKEEDIGLLFGEFRRLDLERNRAVEGTGLGLAIAKNLCEAMGGTISVASSYGNGSTFTATVRQHWKHKEPLAAVQCPPELPILILEENETGRTALENTCDDLNIPVIIEKSLVNFLDQIKSSHFSWILVPHRYTGQVLSMTEELGTDVRIAEICPYGRIPHRDVPTLPLPLYSLPVANLFNNKENRAVMLTEKPDETAFTAPDVRVLIVDDIEVNLLVAKGLMAPYKMQVDTCLSGSEAIRMLRAHNYDLVFLDHMMPEMDGIKTLEMLRSLPDINIRRLPVIALTANAVSGIKELLLSHGMCDYLAKPIDMKSLNRILNKWVPAQKRIAGSARIETEGTARLQMQQYYVEGIDMEAGVAQMNNNIRLYRKVLQSYAAQTPLLLEQIKNQTHDPEQYATLVHGLKGSSYNICAADLGDLAAKLEHDAKRGNKRTIAEETPFLLDKAERLLQSLAQFLNQTEERRGRKRSKKKPDVQILEALNHACTHYDFDQIESCLIELEAYHYQKDGELVTWLREQITQLEYLPMAERLELYLNSR